MPHQIDKATKKRLSELRFRMLLLQYLQRLVDFTPLNRENAKMQSEFASEMEDLLSEAMCGGEEVSTFTGFDHIFEKLDAAMPIPATNQ